MSDDDQEMEDLHSFDDYYGTLNVSREVSNFMELLCKTPSSYNPRFFPFYIFIRQPQKKSTPRIEIFHDNSTRTSIRKPRTSQVPKRYSIASRKRMKCSQIHIHGRFMTASDTKDSKRRGGRLCNDKKPPQNYAKNTNGWNGNVRNDDYNRKQIHGGRS